MPLALLISSHVAASTVGGGVSGLVLNASGIATMLVPTVLYGRQPGLGDPGGAAVGHEIIQSMVDGIEAHGALDRTDLVLTGYFASAAQVFAAAAAVDRVRKGAPAGEATQSNPPRPWIVIDPVMGDAPGGLYVGPDVANAIRDHLLPRADLVAPNAFELGHLTGRALTDLASMLRAARALERPVLVSSLPRHGLIGVMYVEGDEAWIVTHERCEQSPKGTGDVLTAAFVAARLGGADARSALETSVAATVSLVMRANERGCAELPLAADAGLLHEPLISLAAEAL
tara:strand:+ start:2555 stop:3412 length:858 start_codon:yes stop_codon:yes gene_type:complete